MIIVIGAILAALTTTAGCSHARVYRPRPVKRAPKRVKPAVKTVAPVKRAPKTRQVSRLIRENEAVTLHGTTLIAKGQTTQRKGQVTVRLELLNPRNCSGAGSGLVAVDEVDEETVAVCAMDPQNDGLHLARLTVTNDRPHILGPIGKALVIRVGAEPRRLASFSRLGSHWAARFGTPAATFRMGSDATISDGCNLFEVSRAPTTLREIIRGLSRFNVDSVLLPGQSHSGWILIESPSDDPGTRLRLGLYDVVVETRPGAQPARVTSFEFPFEVDAWTVNARVDRLRQRTVTVEIAPAAPVETLKASEIKADTPGRVIMAGTVERLGDAMAQLSNHVGTPVVVFPKVGGPVSGLLEGIRSSVVLIRLKSGERWTGDLMAIDRIQHQ